jgi:Gpi18-like mannosyltransferase
MPIYFALLAVANIAGLGALLVIDRVFVRLAGEEAARCSLMLLAAYPFAFFQAAGYPESLMIFFSALAILLALQGNHLWAGFALGLGVLTRHVTLFAGASLLAAQIRQRGIHPRRLLLNRSILGLLLPWLFLILYCLYQYIVFGNPLAFVAARDQPPWGSMAWWGIGDLLTSEGNNPNVRVMFSYLPFAIIISIGAIALLYTTILGSLLITWRVRTQEI